MLRSCRGKVVYEASCALSFISSSCDLHKSLIVDNNGWVLSLIIIVDINDRYRLDDVFYPIEHGCTVKVAEILSGILLDLCLHTDSRVVVNDHPKLGTLGQQ